MSILMRLPEFGLDLFGPGREQPGMAVRDRRQEVMQLERHLRGLTPGDTRDGGCHDGAARKPKEPAASELHRNLPFGPRLFAAHCGRY